VTSSRGAATSWRSRCCHRAVNGCCHHHPTFASTSTGSASSQPGQRAGHRHPQLLVQQLARRLAGREPPRRLAPKLPQGVVPKCLRTSQSAHGISRRGALHRDPGFVIGSENWFTIHLWELNPKWHAGYFARWTIFYFHALCKILGKLIKNRFKKFRSHCWAQPAALRGNALFPRADPNGLNQTKSMSEIGRSIKDAFK
jgi:hypothetical protein